MNEDIFQRTSLVIGKNNLEKLNKSKVAILGIGGVGSYVLEALARAGIGNFVIIDKDIIDVTNINRQIIALNSTIGEDKVDIAKKRALDINKEINVVAMKENITPENINAILTEDIDYVVDCVDNLDAKIAIISYCNNKNIKCISCMGMGNKINPLDIKVSDIYKTNTCPLAKKVRKILKEIGIKKQKVVFSTEIPIKNKTINILGSVSFVPSVAGLVLASEVVKDIIG